MRIKKIVKMRAKNMLKILIPLIIVIIENSNLESAGRR